MSQHRLSWEFGITQADSSPKKKDVQKEQKILSEDQCCFIREGENTGAVVIAGTETGMALLCFKRHKDVRNQVSLALLLIQHLASPQM